MIRTISISLCTLLLISCGKKNEEVPPEVKPETVTASIHGRVLDETGKPAYNITVKSLDVSTATSIDGEFRFDKVQMGKTDAYVYASAAGYFTTGKTFTPQTGNTGYVDIQLIRKNKITGVSSSAPGLVTFETKNTIQLPDNGVINKAQKTAYTGEINVFAGYIPPGALKSTSIRPGGNFGYDKSGKKKTLRPYGMLAIELEGTGGEKLQLASGKTAAIKMAIPASIASTAPATIPLWYFDEEKGVWKEEGTATKQGDVYVGTVSHFSFWSADMPEDMVNLTVQLKNMQSLPFSFHRMRIAEMENDSSYIYLYTDSSGTINTAVPKNKELRVFVYNSCGDEIKIDTFPPMSEDKNLGIRTIDRYNTTIANVRGKVITCTGAPLVNGYVLIKHGYYNFQGQTDNQGQYSMKVTVCSGKEVTIGVVGGDPIAQKESATPLYRNIIPGGDYTLPTIEACGISNAVYFDGTIDGQPFNFVSPDFYVFAVKHQADYSFPDTLTSVSTSNRTMVIADIRNGSLAFVGPSQPGVYRLSHATVYNGETLDIRVSDPQGGKVTVTEYGAAGQFIAGTMIVDMYNHAQQMKITKMNVRFRVRRDR